MVTGLLKHECFVDKDMSIPEWIESGEATKLLREIGEKHDVKITQEQAEDWFAEHRCDFEADIYEATVRAMEDAVECISEDET